MRDRTPKMLN